MRTRHVAAAVVAVLSTLGVAGCSASDDNKNEAVTRVDFLGMAAPGFRAEYRRLNQLEKKRRPRDIVREQTDTGYLKTDYARQRIAEANAEDQKLYDYVVTRPYPRQVAASRRALAGRASIDAHPATCYFSPMQFA